MAKPIHYLNRPGWLTSTEVARCLSISAPTVHAMCRSGKLPNMRKIGEVSYIPLRSVRAYLQDAHSRTEDARRQLALFEQALQRWSERTKAPRLRLPVEH